MLYQSLLSEVSAEFGQRPQPWTRLILVLEGAL
jgi:hypothetical protein